MSNKAANELVDIIRDIVIRELGKRDTTVLCVVKEKKDDFHYDVYVVPDESTTITNVVNPTNLQIEVNDYVYVYKIGNQLNNSFIVSKVLPFADTTQYGRFTKNIKNTPQSQSSVSMIMNKNLLNKNVELSYLIEEINSNDSGHSFVSSNGTTFEQARPYYQSIFGIPYWMIGKSKGTINIGTLVFDTTDVSVYSGSFDVTNGFSINGQTGKIAANIDGFILTATLYNSENQIISTSTVEIESLLKDSNPSAVTHKILSFTSDVPISKISFTSDSPKKRFNWFNTTFKYRVNQ